MEEIKFASVFPVLNKNTSPSHSKDKKYLKTNIIRKRIPLYLLLSRENCNSFNKKTEADFLQNRVKFFTKYHNEISPTNNKKIHINKNLNLKFISNRNGPFNKLTKTVNIKKTKILTQKKPLIYEILDKFDEVNEKYKEQTRYYENFIKKGDNNMKVHINQHFEGLKNLPLLPKNNSKKQFTYVFNRIKEIQKTNV